MTNEQRVRIWDEINRYVQTCGGDPSKYVYGNTRRQTSVANIETIISELTPSAEVVAAIHSVRRYVGHSGANDDVCDSMDVVSEWLGKVAGDE